jgi:hypothetical protein
MAFKLDEMHILNDAKTQHFGQCAAGVSGHFTKYLRDVDSTQK